MSLGHSESLEPMVLYRPLYNHTGMWVRPFSMFLEPVEFNGRLQPRFSLVAGSVTASEEELSSTVSRMETELSSSAALPTQELMQSYRQASVRFEQDFAASERDILLAKASALMLVQAAANGNAAP